jgi:hypothetical protein
MTPGILVRQRGDELRPVARRVCGSAGCPSRNVRLLLTISVAWMPLEVHAQIVRDSLMAAASGTNVAFSEQAALRAQKEFEGFRFENLPSLQGVSLIASCDEQIGKICYHHDEHKRAPPPEPAAIATRREALISLLDSVAVRVPESRWAAEQRVRYLAEAGRPDSSLSAARACHPAGWRCDVLVGFALHALGRYALADSVYSRAVAQIPAAERCNWRDVDLLIDSDTRQQYDRLPCGDPRRNAFEDRLWFFARTLYSLEGNDSRTEYYARRTMEMMIRDAPDIAFNEADHIEKLLRFGWPRAWVVNRRRSTSTGAGREAPPQVTIWTWSANPAYRYIPPGIVLNDPPKSDSSDWRPQLPPVIARYAPPYAASLSALEHQKAMFRRGDSAIVVMAYDARVTKQLGGGTLTAALLVSPSEKPTDYGEIVQNAPATGVLIARAPWGPLLMSAEVYASERKAVARARYGILAPESGWRVTLSDLLFYKPYGTFPQSVEEVAPHAVHTERLMANEKLGVYWESYGTDPAGEKMKISLTVAREFREAGFLRRLAKALKLVREATPVVVSVEDISARGANVTPRALELDIATLKKGSYIVQLATEVAGQYVVRAEHRIEIIGP